MHIIQYESGKTSMFNLRKKYSTMTIANDRDSKYVIKAQLLPYMMICLGLFSLILQLNLMIHIKMEGVYRFFKISFKNRCSTFTE